ncbi:MAG: DUF4304 domain-containing protein [Rhodocyclaceae bacterium]|nr:MAG: DUF4304 domain-containing protein [Rhodocyclaceae bacterium]
MSESPQPRIEPAIRKIFAPVLREDGFSGSGSTFRLVSGSWIQVVNVQGARQGGSFAINLAVHPLLVPDLEGKDPDPQKITQELCEFRRRLSETGGDQWWRYERTEESMAFAMKAAVSVYERVGRALFAGISGPSSPFITVTPAEFIAGSFDFKGFSSTKVRMALTLARLFKKEGRLADSMALATYGLENVGSAVALRTELQQLSEGK